MDLGLTRQIQPTRKLAADLRRSAKRVIHEPQISSRQLGWVQGNYFPAAANRGKGEVHKIINIAEPAAARDAHFIRGPDPGVISQYEKGEKK